MAEPFSVNVRTAVVASGATETIVGSAQLTGTMNPVLGMKLVVDPDMAATELEL